MEHSAPALTQGGLIIPPVEDHHDITALRMNSRVAWTIETEFLDSISVAVSDGDTIIVASWNFSWIGSVSAYDVHGAQLWSRETGLIISWPSIMASNSTVVFNISSCLLILDENGTVLCRVPTDSPEDASPAIDANGLLYFGSHNGNSTAMYPKGTLRWRYKALGPVLSSPAIGGDGTILFGCGDGRLYAFGPSKTSTSPREGPSRVEYVLLIVIVILVALMTALLRLKTYSRDMIGPH
jgi:outer membrane protein assembly factor BamB